MASCFRHYFRCSYLRIRSHHHCATCFPQKREMLSVMPNTRIYDYSALRTCLMGSENTFGNKHQTCDRWQSFLQSHESNFVNISTQASWYLRSYLFIWNLRKVTDFPRDCFSCLDQMHRCNGLVCFLLPYVGLLKGVVWYYGRNNDFRLYNIKL